MSTPEPGMMPCGRTRAEVAAHLDSAPDAHELQCPWCHSERARLRDLDARVAQELRGALAPARSVPDDAGSGSAASSGSAGAGSADAGTHAAASGSTGSGTSEAEGSPAAEDVVAAVMNRVRASLRPARKTVALAAGTRREVRVTSLELADAVRAVFAGDPDVWVVFVQVRPVDRVQPHRQWRAGCSVSVSPDSAVEDVEQTVVERVAAGVRSLVVADQLTIDVTLEDVHGRALHSSSAES